MKLLTVELRRFASRRANLVFLIVGLLFLAGSLALLALNSHTPGDTELREAEAEAEAVREQVREERAECQRYWDEHPDADMTNPDPDHFEDGEVEAYAFDKDCEHLDPSDVHDSDYLHGVIDFAGDAPDQITFLGVVFAVCALLMAGSFVGAEWSSGGMTNLLLWRPRRWQVYFAKLTAALISMLALTVGAAVLHLGGLYVIATAAGLVGDVSPQWWLDNGTYALRFLVLVAVTTVCGFALSMIGRRTVVAIGSVLAYLAAIEFGLRGLVSTVNYSLSEYWVLSTYVRAWVEGGTPIYSAYINYHHVSERLHMWEGGGVILAVMVVLLAGSAILFNRRDTT